MDRERWSRVEALFHRAVDLDSPTRSALLDSECRGDLEVRAAVERLMRDDTGRDAVLDGGGAVPAAAFGDPMLGRSVGRYRLTELIGAGGMGVVYAAERADGLFEHEVAVKLVRSPLGARELHHRFDQERRALAALSHPHIARLYDGGTTEEGTPFLVMERVHGEPIDSWCDERRLTVDQRLALFAVVARAVHFAHTNLVVHRDLKPSNVLVDQAGVPKLLDFGIARLLDREADPAGATRTPLMTPEFASPEQLAGAPVTTATDVYSLGVVLYVLLTGRRPYRSTSQSLAAWERLVTERTPTRPSEAVLRDEPPAERPGDPPPPDPRALAARFGSSPARLRRRLSGDLDRIVLMALRKEPERRYSSAQELAEDVERHLAHLVIRARRDSFGYRLLRFVQRNRIAVAAAAAVALALIAGILAACVGLVAAWRGERHARQEAARAHEEAQHARVEAESFRGIAAFLQDHVQGTLDATAAERLQTAEATIRRQAEQVRRQYPGQVHLLANMLDALGRVALGLDRRELAEELIDEAYELREEHFGAESLEVALSLESRGQLLYASGDYAAAEPVLRRRLELHRSLPPGTHTDVAAAANDLAAILRNQGRLDEAQALHEEALARRRATGPATLAVAESLNNLSGVLLDRGRPAEAVELLSESLAIRRTILGDAHALTIQSLSNLATATYRTGDEAETRLRFEEAERGARELGPTGVDALARILSALAALDLVDGELDAAQARLDESLALQRSRLPPEHPALTALLERLADLQAQRGDRAQADATWQEVLATRRATLSPSHPLLGRTLNQYGVFLIESERSEEARSALVEAITILRAAGAPDPAELGRAETNLAHVLGLLKRHAEGLEHAREGLRLLEAAPEARPQDLARAREVVEGLEAALARD